LIAAIAVLPIRLGGYTGLLMGDDYAQYEKIVAVLGRDDISMLIARRGLDFFYSYRLRRDAFHFDPEPNWNRAEIWRWRWPIKSWWPSITCSPTKSATTNSETLTWTTGTNTTSLEIWCIA